MIAGCSHEGKNESKEFQTIEFQLIRINSHTHYLYLKSFNKNYPELMDVLIELAACYRDTSTITPVGGVIFVDSPKGYHRSGRIEYMNERKIEEHKIASVGFNIDDKGKQTRANLIGGISVRRGGLIVNFEKMNNPISNGECNKKIEGKEKFRALPPYFYFKFNH